jgi:hypothetical protein
MYKKDLENKEVTGAHPIYWMTFLWYFGLIYFISYKPETGNSYQGDHTPRDTPLHQ